MTNQIEVYLYLHNITAGTVFVTTTRTNNCMERLPLSEIDSILFENHDSARALIRMPEYLAKSRSSINSMIEAARLRRIQQDQERQLGAVAMGAVEKEIGKPDGITYPMNSMTKRGQTLDEQNTVRIRPRESTPPMLRAPNNGLTAAQSLMLRNAVKTYAEEIKQESKHLGE